MAGLPTPHPSKTVAAVALLRSLGYLWLPTTRQWKQAPGLPLSELTGAPGWYRCAQYKGGRQCVSWDGYTLVTQEGSILHFSLDLRPRKWAPSVGYEDRVCFVPVDIKKEMRAGESLS